MYTEPVEQTGMIEDEQVQTPETPAEEPQSFNEPVEPKPTSEQLLADRLSAINQQAAEGAVMARILTDPEIRAVVEARNRGEKVQVVAGTQQVAAPAHTSEELDQMPPSKLVDVIVSQLDQRLGGMIEDRMKQVDSRVKGVEQFMASKTKTALNDQIAEARAKFKDFDALRPDMIALNQENPGLSPTELYQVARIRRGADPVVTRKTTVATERPTQAAPRSQQVPASTNRAGQNTRSSFESALGAAFDSINYPK